MFRPAKVDPSNRISEAEEQRVVDEPGHGPPVAGGWPPETEIAKIFRALGQPSRLRLLECS